MSNMFTNYDYIPTDYVPNNRDVKNIIYNPKKLPYEVTNAKGEVLGVGWNYRDKVVLELCTEGEMVYDDHSETPEVFFNKMDNSIDKMFKIRFFNFRYELLYEDSCPAEPLVQYVISDDLQKILIPNTYHLVVTYESSEATFDLLNTSIFVR